MVALMQPWQRCGFKPCALSSMLTARLQNDNCENDCSKQFSIMFSTIGCTNVLSFPEIQTNKNTLVMLTTVWLLSLRCNAVTIASILPNVLKISLLCRLVWWHEEPILVKQIFVTRSLWVSRQILDSALVTWLAIANRYLSQMDSPLQR